MALSKKEIDETMNKLEEKSKINQVHDLLEEMKRQYIRGKCVHAVETLKFIKQDIYKLDCNITSDEIKRLIDKLPVIKSVEIQSLEALFKLSLLLSDYKRECEMSIGTVASEVRNILQQIDI